MIKIVHLVNAEFKALNSWVLFCLNVFILFLANNSGSTNLNHSSIMLECAVQWGENEANFQPRTYSHLSLSHLFLFISYSLFKKVVPKKSVKDFFSNLVKYHSTLTVMIQHCKNILGIAYGKQSVLLTISKRLGIFWLKLFCLRLAILFSYV